MEIKVLGPGCPKCEMVEKRVRRALVELNITADVEKISDIGRMISLGISATPGVIINGVIKSTGRIPRMEDIKAWIKEAAG